MAPVHGPLVLQFLQSLLTELVPGVHHPAIRLHDDSRTEILVTVPPIAGTGSAAARTQDALIHTILKNNQKSKIYDSCRDTNVTLQN